MCIRETSMGVSVSNLVAFDSYMRDVSLWEIKLANFLFLFLINNYVNARLTLIF